MWATTSLVQNLGVVQEGMETITQPITLLDAPQAGALQVGKGEIRIEGVSHHYGRGSGGLDQVSLTLRPGEKVGVVGRSGAGKSTLVKLMLRFYDTEQGRILIDGQDIAQGERREVSAEREQSGELHDQQSRARWAERPEGAELPNHGFATIH